MLYPVDEQYLIETFKTLVAVPSPVGYYEKLEPVLEEMAAPYGTMTYDNKHTAYLTLDGEDNSKSIMIPLHCDTIGLMVRHIDAKGLIRIACLGGVHLGNAEGQTVTVHTRDGREYTGMLTCEKHSVHVFEDAKTLERSEKTMYVILDEKVKSKEDVLALGVENGCYISIEPDCEYTKTGFLKSRYIDNKAAVACTFAALKYMKEQGLKPKYKTIFAFPYGEELGTGSNYVPEGVSEVVAVDITLMGPELAGTEYTVSIIAADAFAVSNNELVDRLICKAKKAECDYVVDIYDGYASDASAALKCGKNIKVAAFGMTVWNSHCRERTHMDSLKNTVNLLLAYILDI